VAQSDAGNYWVSVSNQVATVLSSNAVLVVRDPPTISSVLVTNGVFQFLLQGSTGVVYTIETSTNLVNWSPLQTFSNVNGAVQFTDTNWGAFPQRFYRITAPK
jgi:hypothetical protein